ncbi:MAG: hypothetical protein QM775_28090 [Pirellulales bacterium]
MTSGTVVAEWKKPDGVSAPEGPSAFMYDPEKSQLVHFGAISDERKTELRGKINDVGYQAAVDRLAFQSQATGKSALTWLLVLGGVSGLLGVQIRSLHDYVGHSCYVGTLDIDRWWPWYVLRPALGFLLGFFIVVLIKTDLLAAAEAKTESGSLWWVGLAAIAGFGVDDVIRRLRLLSKTLFGTEKTP